MIDWLQVKEAFSVTHIFIGVTVYITVRIIIKLLRFIALLVKGASLQTERRVIAYLHHKQRHKPKFSDCTVRDCSRLQNAIR